MKSVIVICEDFSTHPAGRYESDGPFSGEKFRKEHLVQKLRTSDHVKVVLDGTRGYPSSFLEEAFGGLVRSEGFSLTQLRKELQITADSPHFKKYAGLAWHHIENADQASKD